MEDKKIQLRDSEIAYRKGFKWHTLPYEAVRQAYLRVEEVNGRLCCGVASFDMFFLMLKTTEDELIKVEASSKDIVKRMLAEIQKKNEKVEIGYRCNAAHYGRRKSHFIFDGIATFTAQSFRKPRITVDETAQSKQQLSG